MTTIDHLPPAMQHCIEQCTQCHDLCMQTVIHCLARGGRYAEPALIRLLQDCAELCATSADFMLRGSDFHAQTCAICGNICEECAHQCEPLANEDEAIRPCVEICWQCAHTCHAMAGNALLHS